ncbi:MAG: hypothetical protein ACRDYY_18700 [Acidimicrobiales bacterium]
MATNTDADALDVLTSQNRAIADLFGQWDAATATLKDGDDVDVRYKRGSAVKMLLEHLAVREAAIGAVVERLREIGSGDLAGALEADGAERRRRIDRLDELSRGVAAVGLNNSEADTAVGDLARVFEQESHSRGGSLAGAVEQALGPPGGRGLPSRRWVQMHSCTHPSPEPHWFDRIGALEQVRDAYDHLRAAPNEGVDPSVDPPGAARPGPRG